MKPEWMQIKNQYSNRGGYDDTAISFGFNEGVTAGQKKLLEHLMKISVPFVDKNNMTTHIIKHIDLIEMYKQLEEQE